MKKLHRMLLLAAAAATFLTACARGAQTQDTVGAEPQVQTGDTVSEEESTDGSGDAATLPDLTESRPVAYAPCVRVNGVIYQDTGFLSSMVGCGNMDGKITTSVESTQLPAKDDEANFGKGYGYQFGADDTLLVYWDDEPHIFRNVDSVDTSIPAEVLHFTAEVKEVNEGNLLVTYIAVADGFQEMSAGDYVVSADNLMDEVQTGDTVEIWFSGYIQETDPAQIGLAYRIEKVNEK